MKVVKKHPKPVNDFFITLTLYQGHFYPIPQWAHVLRALPIIADRNKISVDQLIKLLEPWTVASEGKHYKGAK